MNSIPMNPEGRTCDYCNWESKWVYVSGGRMFHLCSTHYVIIAGGRGGDTDHRDA